MRVAIAQNFKIQTADKQDLLTGYMCVLPKYCRNTLKTILRKLNNATFANKKIRERIEEESKNKEV